MERKLFLQAIKVIVGKCIYIYIYFFFFEFESMISKIKCVHSYSFNPF